MGIDVYVYILYYIYIYHVVYDIYIIWYTNYYDITKVRIFVQYAPLRWGFRTPKWEHKSGAENYFPFEFELQN